MTHLPRLVLTFFLLFLAVSATAQSITVTVEDVRNSNGVIQYIICQQDEFDQAIGEEAACSILGSTKAKQGSVTFARELPAGSYAVMLLHDENEDGKTERTGLLPTEGIGFSRNPRLIFGIPSFEQVVVRVKGETSISVQTKYFN
ncbi:MAG: hypothetical protein CME01_13235 [Geminicoccus sp.]|nr:hypothetical protein [Geminicoccus sp.]